MIELMVVIVILGILAAIAIPNYIRVVNEAKEAEVKSNMHTTQFEVELYGTDHSGIYPASVDSISDRLPENMKNPFNTGEPAVQDANEPDVEGVVEYKTEGPYDSYLITGLGRNAELVPMTLSEGLVD